MSNISIPKPSGDKYIAYVSQAGKKGNKTVQILKENSQFLSAFNSDAGFAVLRNLVSKHEEAFRIVSAVDPPPKLEDRVRYQILQEIIQEWASIIYSYVAAVETVNKAQE